MSLDLAVLQTRLAALVDPTAPGFLPFQAERGEAARRFCVAYDGYTAAALDFSGDRLLSANLPAMQASLSAALQTTSDAEGAAHAFALAFVAYWTGASFAVGIPPRPGTPVLGGSGILAVETSSVVTSTSSAVLEGRLTTEFHLWTSGQQKASGMAQALHDGTLAGVTVLISGFDATPPPGGPLPCTASGPLF